MSLANPAEQLLREAQPEAALKALQDEIRNRPADAKLRVFLFQLLCVLGRWERAMQQLQVIGELDAAALPMVQAYREAIHCEGLRDAVFAGRKVPLLFGEPEEWLALLVEALLKDGQGQAADAQHLRERAFELAPATAGQADGQAFEWIADADMRLGPLLEALINGRYYWVPWSRLQAVRLEAPADLRDRVWMPAQLMFSNGGEVAALLPTRYPGSAAAEPELQLARATRWLEREGGQYIGLGQRMLTTDVGDLALMDLREIELKPA